MTRRQFFRLLASIGGLAAMGGASYGYARAVEPRWLAVEKVQLRVRGLAEHLTGLRLAQISDIHISAHNPASKLIRAVEIINRLAPDLVLLTGDYVSRRAESAAELVEPLRRLEAPAFAVLGNHDLWTNRAVVSRQLGETPAHLLVNEGVEALPGLFIAGVDDVWSGRPDLRSALQERPSQATTLLLAHEPDYFDQVVAADAPVAVQFSGHSHGGQVRLPSTRPDGAGLRSRAIILPRYGEKYPIGHYQVGNRQLYTNRGLGVWPLPYRINCRPEITLFTLFPG